MRDTRMSIQDDFSFIHSQYGSYSHDAAPFLPWHRYFIQAYENALREYCDFEGTLPYWDWTKDYENLFESPIWNIEDGFGPDGDKNGPESVAFGHCVRSGPFAKWNPSYYNGSYQPHCLSRGFMDERTAKKVGNATMNPRVLEAVILNESNYYDVLLRIEDVSHATIPYLVQGDFRVFTAPNDPIFFLHHGQIDRIWWSWQRSSKNRFWQFNGKSRDNSAADGEFSLTYLSLEIS